MRIWKKSHQFVSFLNEYNGCKALVLTHQNPDPDCLAGSMLLRRVFQDGHKMDCTIGYSGIIGRAENRAMAELCKIPLVNIRQLNLKDFDFLALIDTQPGVGNNALPGELKPTVVVDHHPRKQGSKGVKWVDVRTRYGASATIAHEYFWAHNLKLNTLESTALFYAIKSETQDLGREASTPDRRLYFTLAPQVDNELLYEITNAKLDRGYFQMLDRALGNARTHNDVLITELDEIRIPDHVAEVADMLLRLRSIRWTLVMGYYRQSIFLSLRTTRRDMDAGAIMESLVENIGTGGGHEMMAGGRIDQVPAEKKAELNAEIAERLLKALRKRAGAEDLIVSE